MEYRTFSAQTASELRYMLWRPEDAQPSERLPLLVFLHGAGERGTDLDLLTVHSVPRVFSREHHYRCVMLAPQCPGDDTWMVYIKELRALIEQVVRDEHCDPDRISLTGVSMGGFGTWELASTYPGLFSCAAPVCGGGMSWRAENLVNLPIRAFHGTADTVVPPERSVEMADAVRACGGRSIELFLCHGVGHDVWNTAYEHTDLIDWMLAQKRG